MMNDIKTYEDFDSMLYWVFNKDLKLLTRMLYPDLL